MLLKQKKNHPSKGKRFLISVTVMGSTGPIRFVVYEDSLVATVIDTALKSYTREGRLPILGSDLNDFVLYCPIAGTEVISPWETIGSVGVRNFMMCKKSQTEKKSIDGEKSTAPIRESRKGAGNWRAWFHKSLNLKIPSN